jgi:hypothetical protein
MRWLLAIAVCSVLAGCAATEGPLLRALVAPDGGSPPAQEDAGAGTQRLTPGMSFQYQLTGSIDTTVDAELFVIDLFTASRTVIASLHARGRVVVAYLSAGTHEPYRSDAERFPASAIGQPLSAYPDESWLDVRDETVRALMAARLDLARDKGFDGVLPTNLTAYAQDSGFALTAADQRAYTLWLAGSAQARELTAGMSGDYAQIAELEHAFDFALHSGCIARGNCGVLSPFTEQGKAVFDVEYEGELSAICEEAARLGLTAILKRRSLDAYRMACP